MGRGSQGPAPRQLGLHSLLQIQYRTGPPRPAASQCQANGARQLAPTTCNKYQNLIEQQRQWIPAVIAKQAAADAAAIITYYFMVLLQIITPHNLLDAQFLLIMSH